MPELVFRPFALDERPEVEVIDVVIFLCLLSVNTLLLSFLALGSLYLIYPGVLFLLPSAGEIVPIVVVSLSSLVHNFWEG